MAITNIYKGALERSDIQKIYKGTTLLYEKVLPPQGETWVINENPNVSNDLIVEISGKSHLKQFNYFIIQKLYYQGWESQRGIDYNGFPCYSVENGWVNGAYRTVTFETAPTGSLLTWLGVNAVKE